MANNLESLWSSVLAELKLSLSKTIFQTLFSNTSLKGYKNQVAVIGCPNPYLADLIEKRYYSLIKAALDRQTNKNISLTFEVEKKAGQQKEAQPGPLFEKKKEAVKKTPSNIISAGLNPRFNFANFVVGNANHFVFAAAQGIIKNPGTTYNPLFVWGGVGVGKTHLMQAIGNELIKLHPEWRILYANAETFGNELINSLKEKTMTRFKYKYRNLDLLLIDDVQFIAGKEYIQEEFFHTFNSLYLAGKQIVITSDRKPEEIQPLEDRLTSRFMGGLTVDVQPPDFEMRVAILKQKAEQRRINLPEDAITFIAETVDSNARELEGSLIQIAARAQTQGISPNLAFVKDFFGIKRTGANNKKVSYRRILSVVARHYKIKTSELKGRSRKKEIAIARHIAAYFLRREIKMPLQQVGLVLGGRDHTTILHAEEKIDRLFSTNQQIRHEIIEMRKTIYQ